MNVPALAVGGTLFATGYACLIAAPERAWPILRAFVLLVVGAVFLIASIHPL